MSDRPNPLKQAAAKVGAAWAALAGLVGLAASYGMISAAQADAIRAVGEQVPGLIEQAGPIVGAAVAAGATLVGAFRTAAAGREGATPVADPRDHDGTPLVRQDTGLAPAAGAHALER